MNNLLQNLNERQQEAVCHTEGPLLIFAGAGSGKTRVIVHRIAYLIKEKKIPPYKILAVTFTNKAALEMKNRVIDFIGPAGYSVFVKTFHAMAVFILRRHGEAIGISNNFTIYDQNDQQTLLKQILIDLRLDPKKIKPASLANKISELKDQRLYLETKNLDLLLADYSFNFAPIFKEYQKRLKEQEALDFNDLLLKTVELLKAKEEILKDLQNRWKYLMIDEYQDTNYAQYLIAKYLSKESQNICVVGDDDQSIYSWRGADIRNILDFEQDYQQVKVITLNENYRSTEPILQAASAIIKNNKDRKEKNLLSCQGDGEKIKWCQTNNEYGEAEFVISSILSKKNREGLKNKDFAIFYRTNAQSRLFEDFLRRENIPYRVVGGLKFYARKEIKDILAYLRFISNQNDKISMLRVINNPPRGIGRVSVEKIRALAQKEGVSEWKIINDGYLIGKISKGIELFKNIINVALDLNEEVPEKIKLSKLALKVFEISGYKKNLEEEKTLESHSRLDNIYALINSIEDYELTNPEANLEQFLQDISLFTSEEDPNENFDLKDKDDVVTLMTLHNSKGLEFPIVFLTGLEENTFPHKFSLDTEEELEEERRLCYVGITRAKEEVFLTNSEVKRTFGGEVEYQSPSRFLFEVPKDLIELKSFRSSDFRFNESGQSFQQREFKPKVVSRSNNSKFSLKDRVIHPKYGVGQIFKIEGTDDNVKISISFGRARKTFLEKYTHLEKIY